MPVEGYLPTAVIVCNYPANLFSSAGSAGNHEVAIGKMEVSREERGKRREEGGGWVSDSSSPREGRAFIIQSERWRKGGREEGRKERWRI
jgi:hypothetical protein